MAKPLSILFVASEVVPYAKESGVADVAFSLPVALRELGHDVRVILPKYGSISERRNKIHEISRLRDIEIPFNGVTELATIKSSSISNGRSKVQTYIVTNRHFFDERKGIYHDPKTWEPYPDNAERFMFYSLAIIETCILLGWIPDIIHCNDWQTAFLPGLLREKYASKFKKTKIVFTIHNFYRQGVFELDKLKNSLLPKEAQKNYRHKHKLNLMKGGVQYADYVTTVSPNYATEILKDKQYSNGLNISLKENKNNFQGILNAIDLRLWNPTKDKDIDSLYEQKDIETFKARNKAALSQKFGLEYKPKTPLLAMIPRIGYQKGVDLFLRTAEKIFSEDYQMVFLGQGTDNELKEKLQQLAEKHPDKFAIKIGFDEKLSHQIEAGADMFLMPSQYEPCGLNAFFSLAYATVPIVRNTGGLSDIVQEYNSETKEGNGFLFDEYEPKAFFDSIRKARELYNKKETWLQLLRKNMNQDYSWVKSAKKYEEIYKSIR